MTHAAWAAVPQAVPPPTDRLCFRLLEAADAPALAEAFADDQAHRFYPLMRDPARVLRWIEGSRRHSAAHGFALWGLQAKDDGRLIGDAGLSWQQAGDERVLEIGWHLRLAERGRGFATEAARACLAHAFERLGAERVGSIVDPANAASIAVAQRVHAAQREFAGPQGTRWLFFTDRVDGTRVKDLR
jgi:RimJ/RimL family protein N-acetyltransferase